MAKVEPLPGKLKPSASVKQFIELAVNIPEHEPQVGQAERSIVLTSASLCCGLAAATIASTKSSLTGLPAITALPDSIGPPETKIVGIFKRNAAFNMPGVILSQLEIQISASAQCAFTMYSTASEINSRDGSEYNIPLCPIAMPSSIAMVLNSLATPPAASTSRATNCPKSFRWTCPGTNWVKELAIAIIGFWKSSSFMPVARHKERAPAILRPAVEVRER